MNFEISKQKTPTLCFGTMCKNEEDCILDTLKSVYKFIDYWIVCDTGSTDKTCELVTEFFKEKNIPGKLYHDEWKGFHINKTLLFERCHDTADYLLHLDADDWLVGEINKDDIIKHKSDIYMITNKRGSNNWAASMLYNNRLKWKYCGVAHNIIKCLNKDEKDLTKSDYFLKTELWVNAEERGIRALDPKKYHKDAELLKGQFFDTLYDDPDGLNNRSCFYTAQSYMDSGQNREALNWYCLYLKLQNTWIEERYECYLRISELLIRLKRSFEEIENQINRSIKIFPDRAEGYYILALHCNHINMQEKAYQLFMKALDKKYDEIKDKYTLFVRPRMYGKYIYDELSVSCYWTERIEEGKKYLDKIIDDEEFSDHKERFIDNLKHFNNKLNK
tara:strand:+ start:9765 stop:10934 length:1170 start_codon:yes stop_codon:yes gene_type:complete